LIKRHIDPDAKFFWLKNPAALPRKAVGFDFDGAQFTHVDNQVTFEVLLKSFGLDADGALQKLAHVVHYLDVGGIPVSDAPGIAVMLTGAKQRSRDDDHLLKHAFTLLDLLYVAYSAGEAE